MKPLAFILLALFITFGAYLSSFDTEKDNQVMIEDSVGSSMAAPVRQ